MTGAAPRLPQMAIDGIMTPQPWISAKTTVARTPIGTPADPANDGEDQGFGDDLDHDVSSGGPGNGSGSWRTAIGSPP